MNIPEFVELNVGPIVDAWAKFARTKLPASHRFTHLELADHAKILLLAICADIGQSQGAQATHEKSQGNKPDNAPDITRIARDHATQRFDQGFTFDDLVSEFRALRASVIRRWREQVPKSDDKHLDDLTRFGESMDQAFSESASMYTKRVEAARNLLLGVLGHDLRTPLGVVHMSASYLLRADTLTGAQSKAVGRILTASERMKGMVKDILDFTLTAYGVALPITPAPADFGEIARYIVSEVATLHPDSKIELTCDGDLRGRWDGPRVGQMIANIIANAVDHGAAERPVSVVVSSQDGVVSLRVHNEGPPIPVENLQNLFTPLRQSPSSEGNRVGSSGLGLGLYITKEIAEAHGGSVEMSSGEGGTTLFVRLPRTPPLSADRRARPPNQPEPTAMGELQGPVTETH